jgi:hypothetical protein
MVSKKPILVLLSFPLVGNPSERFWTSQNDRRKKSCGKTGGY